MILHIGTYGNGIQTFAFNGGKPEFLYATEVENPSYMAFRDGRLYAVSEVREGAKISMFDATTPKLKLLDRKDLPSISPCHVSLLERQAVTSDYNSASLTAIDLTPDGFGNVKQIKFSGSGPNPQRQSCPHIHSSWPSPDGKSLIVADLGSDRLYIFSVANGKIGEDFRTLKLPAGSGPRHCTFSHDGKYLYVATELSGHIMAFSWPDCELIQDLEFDTGNPGGAAHLAFAVDTEYLFASIRLRNDGIAVFDKGTEGKLTQVGRYSTGLHPRHFAISGDGKYIFVACKDSNSVEIRPLDGSQIKEPVEIIPTESPVFLELVGYGEV